MGSKAALEMNGWYKINVLLRQGRHGIHREDNQKDGFRSQENEYGCVIKDITRESESENLPVHFDRNGSGKRK